jgi:hypothetical protein
VVRGRCDNKKRVRERDDIRRMALMVEEGMQVTSKAGKSKERIFFLSFYSSFLFQRNKLIIFSRKKHILISAQCYHVSLLKLQNCKIINLCTLKPLNFWQFVATLI